MITLYDDGTLLAKYIENKFYTVSVSLDLEEQRRTYGLTAESVSGICRLRD